jgi:hypothetical protein
VARGFARRLRFARQFRRLPGNSSRSGYRTRAALVGLAGHGSTLPMASIIAGCGLLAYAAHRLLVMQEKI